MWALELLVRGALSCVEVLRHARESVLRHAAEECLPASNCEFRIFVFVKVIAASSARCQHEKRNRST